MSPAVIVIHGGAWAVPDSLARNSRQGVRTAALTGHKILRGGGSALDAVTQAVKTLEDDPAFDAGENKNIMIYYIFLIYHHKCDIMAI